MKYEAKCNLLNSKRSTLIVMTLYVAAAYVLLTIVGTPVDSSEFILITRLIWTRGMDIDRLKRKLSSVGIVGSYILFRRTCKKICQTSIAGILAGAFSVLTGGTFLFPAVDFCSRKCEQYSADYSLSYLVGQILMITPPQKHRLRDDEQSKYNQ